MTESSPKKSPGPSVASSSAADDPGGPRDEDVQPVADLALKDDGVAGRNSTSPHLGEAVESGTVALTKQPIWASRSASSGTLSGMTPSRYSRLPSARLAGAASRRWLPQMLEGWVRRRTTRTSTAGLLALALALLWPQVTLAGRVEWLPGPAHGEVEGPAPHVGHHERRPRPALAALHGDHPERRRRPLRGQGAPRLRQPHRLPEDDHAAEESTQRRHLAYARVRVPGAL